MLIKSLDPSCNISDNPYIAFSLLVNQSYPVILLPYLLKKKTHLRTNTMLIRMWI